MNRYQAARKVNAGMNALLEALLDLECATDASESLQREVDRLRAKVVYTDVGLLVQRLFDEEARS